MAKIDVFLSYHRADTEMARQIASALTQAGLTVWVDSALAAGAAYRREIEARLHEARRVLVLWSPDSVQSAFVLDEASFARSLGKLVPVLVRSTSLPLGFGAIQTVDLSAWSGDPASKEFQVLLHGLGREDTPSREQQPAPESPPEAQVETVDTPDQRQVRAAVGPSAGVVPDVFVAYAREDSERCNDLVIQLRSQGLDVFYDQFIEGGDRWRELIANSIKACTVFIVLFSQHSRESNEVRNEINLAVNHSKSIVPVFLEALQLEGELELMLSRLQYVNAFENLPERLRETAERAKEIVAVVAFDQRKGRPVNVTRQLPVTSDNDESARKRSAYCRSCAFWSAVLSVVLAVALTYLTGAHIRLTLVEYAAVFAVALLGLALPYVALVMGLYLRIFGTQ